jgi:hypothetical protein
MSELYVVLGQRITTRKERDAIHVAVLPVTASGYLRPGAKVIFEAPGSDVVVLATSDNYDGIVDPFLPTPSVLSKGDRFWMLLKPNSVTDMRHHWIHPKVDIPSEADIEVSRQRLTKIAELDNQTIEGMLFLVKHFINGRLPYIQDGSETLRDAVYENRNLFWDDVENVLGIKVPPDIRNDAPFDCSC